MNSTLKYKFMKNIRKVLLFIPPAFTFKDRIDINPLPPLGLGYLGSVLEERGIEVKIVDCLIEGWDNSIDISSDTIRIGLSFEDIEKIIRDFSPDIVGVNNLFTKQRQNAQQIYEIAKKIDKNIITVAGGAHPTVMPELVLADENVDYVVIGEGDQTIIELVRLIEGKTDISALDGVGYRENGEIKIIPKTRFIENLDTLPFPARHLLSMEKYFQSRFSHGVNRITPYASILTSRGCPFRCSFCSTHKVWSKRYRARSAGNVLKEIKLLVDTYGVKELLFEDDNLLLDKARALAIFDGIINSKFDIIWRTPNGVAIETLDKEVLDRMKASGCYQIGLGLESGNKYVLDNIIKKPIDLDKFRATVKYAKKIGLEVIIFLVVGMPGETLDQMRETFNFVRSLGCYTLQHISIATPYPGSELYDICVNKGYFKKDFDYDRLSIRKANIDTEHWKGEDVIRLIKEERAKARLGCFFKNPVLFFKALVPDRVKALLKKRHGYRRAKDVYTGFKAVS